MREFVSSKNGLHLKAFSSTNVVLLAWNVDDEKSLAGVVGFALHRQQGNRGFFLRGNKEFAPLSVATSDESLPASEEQDVSESGELVSQSEETSKEKSKKSYKTTLESPIQGFYWSDYTAHPGVEYQYTLYAMKGEPGNLIRDDGLKITIKTETGKDGKHSVFFNRGVAGSQGYTRKFGLLPPDQVPNREAFKWLSNGLEEALMSYLDLATDNSFSLRVAAYEFKYEPFLLALKAASERGVDVKIVVDWKVKKDGSFKKVKDSLDHVEESDNAIKNTDFPRELLIERRAGTSFISHNKFIILLKDNKPQQVWTGSTNFTEGGIFGQSNNGHIVRDCDIAQSFLDYWTRLSTDPTPSKIRQENEQVTPLPSEIKPNSTTLLFSPRLSDDALFLYTELLTRARHSVCFTAAFGVNNHFSHAMAKGNDNAVLRFILLEKSDRQTEKLTEKDARNRVAVGAVIGEADAADLGALPEQLTGLNDHVGYIHTKYLLIDPFSDDPIVICGSANFSRASNVNNDENMMIVRGDTHLADSYVVNFMRLFRHFDYRHKLKKKSIKDHHLTRDDSWQKPFFEENSARSLERMVLCAPIDKSEPTTWTWDLDELKIRHAPPPRESKASRTVSFDSNKNEFTLQFAYNKALVEKLKADIPSPVRRWVADKKFWVLQANDATALPSIETFLIESKFKMDKATREFFAQTTAVVAKETD